MTYHRPETLEQALPLLARPELRVLAGGTDVFPAVSTSQLSGEILDITAISALSGITRAESGWRIGATTTWSEIAQADLPPAFDALKQAASEVGSVQIQNSATIGGNLCNASPAADGVPPLMVLDAEIELTSATGVRRVALEKFITGVRQIDLQAGELLTAILVPNSAVQGRSVFAKLGARKYLVISVAMVSVRLEVSAGKITNAAIAVGSCAPVATRLRGFEDHLVGCSVQNPEAWLDALKQDLAESLAPISDIRADAGYREAVSMEVIQRTIAKAAI